MIRWAARLAREGARAARRGVRRAWRRNAVVLCYHRVNRSSQPDPWQLRVAPERFRQQLEALRAHATVVPLAELDERSATRGARPVVALTFDDGYADNLTNALPLLDDFGFPATFFITTGAIGRREPFWWDALAALVPDRARLAELHARLWVLDEAARDAALRAIAAEAGRTLPALPEDLPLDEAQLRRLAAAPRVEIGAHTMTHCHLPSLDPASRRAEIAGSLVDCERLVGRRPASFAYPYGALAAALPAEVAACGFARACSTEPDAWWHGGDRMLIPRFGVGDWDGERFARMLRWYWSP